MRVEGKLMVWQENEVTLRVSPESYFATWFDLVVPDMARLTEPTRHLDALYSLPSHPIPGSSSLLNFTLTSTSAIMVYEATASAPVNIAVIK